MKLNSEKNKYCILITGMHRSGTSLTVHILKELGVNFGKKLISSHDDNPEGFGEDSDIANLNINFLKKFIKDSDGIKEVLPATWRSSENANKLEKDLKNKIEEDYLNNDEIEVFGIKDPRISILLPVYLKVLDDLNIKTLIVIPKRNELDVSLSLLKRNNIKIEDSLKAITHYYRNIKSVLKEYPKKIDNITINYEDYFENREFIKIKLKSFFRDILKVDNENLNQALNVVSNSLRHNQSKSGEFTISLLEKINQLEKENLDLDIRNKNIADSVRDNSNSNKEEIKKEVDNFKTEILNNNIENSESLYSKIISESEKNKKVILEKIDKQEKIETENLDLKYRLKDRNNKVSDLKEINKDKEIRFQQLQNNYEENRIDREKTISHLKNTLSDRNNEIKNLQTVVVNFERSLTWKVIKTWDMVLGWIFPKGTFLNSLYLKTLNRIQNFTNDSLSHVVFSEVKKRNNKKHTKEFWKRFKEIKGDDIDILFINHDESRTGAPRIVYDVAEYYEENEKEKNIAMLSLKKGTMTEDFEERFSPVIHPEDLYSNLSDQEKIEKIIKKVNPKLVYSNSLDTFLYSKVAKEMGIKTIFHIHELDIAFQFVLSKNQRNNFKNYSDNFIAVSQPVYDLLVHKLGCDPGKVSLINAFISRERIKKLANEIDKDLIYEELNINKEEKEVNIVCVGMFIYRKGADYFMKISKIIKEKGYKCNFIWIGGMPFKEPFMSDFKEYSPYFTLLGEKTNPFPYLNIADFFILTSREDPFPLVALESLSLGKPVIAFKDSGGIHEAVGEGGSIVKDMNLDAFEHDVEMLINDKEKRENMSRNAVNEQKRYDSTIALPKITKLINQQF